MSLKLTSRDELVPERKDTELYLLQTPDGLQHTGESISRKDHIGRFCGVKCVVRVRLLPKDSGMERDRNVWKLARGMLR